jgi:heparosan-N-sulfate-glucuronate 5-epimerase
VRDERGHLEPEARDVAAEIAGDSAHGTYCSCAVVARPARTAAQAGFFSSASRFPLLPGGHVVPGEARGYYIDLRMKTGEPQWPPDWLPIAHLWVPITQWALGCYERYVDGDGDAWLQAATDAGRYLLEAQDANGAFVHKRAFPHTFDLQPPWVSGITQGQAASLFARLAQETADDAFAEAAVASLRPLRVPSAEGGVQALLDGRPWPEEYPTSPPSFVLNGGIFAIFGQYDVSVALGDAEAAREFDESIETLVRNAHRWDTGYWSLYGLYPWRVTNVASSAYHLLHTSQFRMLHLLTGRPELAAVADRFERYAASPVNRTRALARKVLFRLVVPRR